MPGMDGFETAALIRSREKTQQTPIIFFTAMAEAEAHVFRSYSLGAVDFIRTPVVPEILKAKVSVFVDLYKTTEQVKRQGDEMRLLQEREDRRVLAETTARLEAETKRNRFFTLALDMLAIADFDGPSSSSTRPWNAPWASPTGAEVPSDAGLRPQDDIAKPPRSSFERLRGKRRIGQGGRRLPSTSRTASQSKAGGTGGSDGRRHPSPRRAPYISPATDRARLAEGGAGQAIRRADPAAPPRGLASGEPRSWPKRHLAHRHAGLQRDLSKLVQVGVPALAEELRERPRGLGPRGAPLAVPTDPNGDTAIAETSRVWPPPRRRDTAVPRHARQPVGGDAPGRHRDARRRRARRRPEGVLERIQASR